MHAVANIVAAVLGLLGVLVLVRGVARGVVQVRPQCRRCGHPLTDAQIDRGIAPGERCPECGAELSGRGVRRVAWPVRRAVIAVVLFAAAVTVPNATPDLAWRVANLPAWWIVNVERPLDAESVDALALAKLRDARIAGELSDGLLRQLLDDLLDSIDAYGAPPSLAGARVWEDLAVLGIDADLLTTAEVAAIHDAYHAIDMEVGASPPDQVFARLGSSRSGATTAIGGVRNPPRQAGVQPLLRPAAVRVVAVRVDDVLVDEPIRGAAFIDLLEGFPDPISSQMTARTFAAGSGLAAGRHTIEVDFETTLGSHVWMRTVGASFEQPEWPPPGMPETLGDWMASPDVVVRAERSAATGSAAAEGAEERIVVTIELPPAVSRVLGWDRGRSIAGGVPGLVFGRGNVKAGDSGVPTVLTVTLPIVDAAAVPGSIDVPIDVDGVSVRVRRDSLGLEVGPLDTIGPWLHGRITRAGSVPVIQGVPIVGRPEVGDVGSPLPLDADPASVLAWLEDVEAARVDGSLTDAGLVAVVGPLMETWAQEGRLPGSPRAREPMERLFVDVLAACQNDPSLLDADLVRAFVQQLFVFSPAITFDANANAAGSDSCGIRISTEQGWPGRRGGRSGIIAMLPPLLVTATVDVPGPGKPARMRGARTSLDLGRGLSLDSVGSFEISIHRDAWVETPGPIPATLTVDWNFGADSWSQVFEIDDVRSPELQAAHAGDP